MTYTPALTFGEILYQNALRSAPFGIGALNLPVSGFPAANATDWRDFSLCRLASGVVGAKVEWETSTLASTFSLSRAVLWFTESSAFTGAHVRIYRGIYDSPSWVWDPVWDSGAIASATAAQRMLAFAFATLSFTAGQRIKVAVEDVNGTMDIRQFFVGNPMVLPMGQWGGLPHPQIPFGQVMENVISTNGSIIGRNVRRVEKQSEIDLPYLDPSWVRSTWAAFLTHAARYPFFWRWSPTEWASDVAFAAATEIPAPLNERPGPLMHAKLPVRFLA